MQNSTILQIFGQHFLPEPDPQVPGDSIFFQKSAVIPVGALAALFQVQIDEAPKPSDRIHIRITDASTGRIIALKTLDLNGHRPADLDDIMLTWLVSDSAIVVLTCTSSLPAGKIRLRHLKVVQSSSLTPDRGIFRDLHAVFQSKYLKAVFVGTTNICNANCPHCPTNKHMTSHIPQGVMSMDLFARFVEQLDAINVSTILFGVFGEPFLDPHLEERIRLVKSRRPDLPIDIATNAGVATPERVAAIADHVRRIAIHMEAVTPEVYDKLMAPLKAKDVFPNIDEIIRMAPAKIALTTPIHRGNIHEVPALQQHSDRHGLDIRFSPLQTRATDRTLARRVALAPTGGFWQPNLLDILVLDWDGTVLTTCDDFLRRQPLGNLADSSLNDILTGDARRTTFDNLCTYRWHALPSICDAIVDDWAVVEAFGEVGRRMTDRWTITTTRLQCSDLARRSPNGISLGHEVATGEAYPAIFGPYIPLGRGRYLVRFAGMVVTTAPSNQLRIRFEVTANTGLTRLASCEKCSAELVGDATLEFSHDIPEAIFEFRVFVVQADPSAAYTLSKVSLHRMSVVPSA